MPEASTTQNTYYDITLLRHGESAGNAGGIFQGQVDYPLTETGLAQARALAVRWQAEGQVFDRLISSPLSRARQTAMPIAEVLGLPVEFDALWMERDYGQLAGLTPEEIDARGLRSGFMHPYQPVGETGESRWSLYLRAGQALQTLLTRGPARYLVVSHGGILNMVLYTILGIVPQASSQGARFSFRNTAFAVVLYDPNRHAWHLDRLNDHQHWPDSNDEG
jgi:broad specificity phosphatase PhoE